MLQDLVLKRLDTLEAQYNIKPRKGWLISLGCQEIHMQQQQLTTEQPEPTEENRPLEASDEEERKTD